MIVYQKPSHGEPPSWRLIETVAILRLTSSGSNLRKDKYGQWEKYNAYGVDYTGFPLGHGEKSVIRLLRWGLEMTDDEIIAIRWHVSGFDLAFQSPEIRNNYNDASGKCPLLAVLKATDGLVSHVLGT